jgi:hypothetical protein
VIEKIGNRFRRDVDAYAKAHGVPVLHLAKPDRSRWDDRKLDHVRPYLDRAEAAGRHGVVAVVAAQEFQWVFGATKETNGNAVWFDSNKSERRVSCYYFYVNDRQFGPGFIKICSCFPYLAKYTRRTALSEVCRPLLHPHGLSFKAVPRGRCSGAAEGVCVSQRGPPLPLTVRWRGLDQLLPRHRANGSALHRVTADECDRRRRGLPLPRPAGDRRRWGPARIYRFRTGGRRIKQG